MLGQGCIHEMITPILSNDALQCLKQKNNMKKNMKFINFFDLARCCLKTWQEIE